MSTSSDGVHSLHRSHPGSSHRRKPFLILEPTLSHLRTHPSCLDSLPWGPLSKALQKQKNKKINLSKSKRIMGLCWCNFRPKKSLSGLQLFKDGEIGEPLTLSTLLLNGIRSCPFSSEPNETARPSRKNRPRVVWVPTEPVPLPPCQLAARIHHSVRKTLWITARSSPASG